MAHTLQGCQAEAGVQRLRAVLTAAGQHALVVSLAGPGGGAFARVPARGAPGAVTVVPGPAASRRTAVRDLPRAVTAGVAAEFTVVPTDAYGNSGASGGAFAAELAPVSGGGVALPCRIDETVLAGGHGSSAAFGCQHACSEGSHCRPIACLAARNFPA